LEHEDGFVVVAEHVNTFTFEHIHIYMEIKHIIYEHVYMGVKGIIYIAHCFPCIFKAILVKIARVQTRIAVP
jgi:hypothetical protein